jgi:hypothetical protein
MTDPSTPGREGEGAQGSEASTSITTLGRAVTEWVQGLSGWKRMAAEAVAPGPCPQPAVDTIFQQFLFHHKLAAASPGSGAEVSAFSEPAAPRPADTSIYRVKAVQHVSGVNRLVPGATLEFGDQLTIVYGPNAAGKSGFARILKASCFTRASDRDVLGDVWASTRAPQQAVVVVSAAGNEQRLRWTPKSELPLLRERVAVFDMTSVRAHIDEKNTLVFAPAGLEVFSRMADVYGELKAKLEREIASRRVEIRFSPPDGTSAVTLLLSTLGEKTNVEELRRLARFGEAESARLACVEATLREEEAQSPERLAALVDKDAGRLQHLRASLEEPRAALNGETVQLSKKLRAEIRILEQQSQAASAAEFAQEPIQPVGTDAWLRLIAAAAAYAEEVSPGFSYPDAGAGGRCVLCQQPLEPEALARLKRFWTFTRARVRREHEAATSRLRRLVERAKAARIDMLLPESSGIIDSSVAERIHPLLSVAHSALAAMRAAIAEDAEPPARSSADELAGALDETLRELRARRASIPAASTKVAIRPLREERTLLLHRKYLASVLGEAERICAAAAWAARARSALNDLRTTELSTKQRTLTEDLLKSDYARRLLDECHALGFDLPVEIQLSGTAGKALRSVRLTGSAGRDSPTRILSEGEQRALALADFLTESDVASDFDCLVFDDPVTSHDHERKARVAERLVREAKDQQVVVFTHDRVFISFLVSESKAKRVTAKCVTLAKRATDGVPGSPDEIVFPEPAYEEQALADATEALASAKRLKGRDQAHQVLRGFGRLRTAYEELIQRDFFAGVVRRWNEQIRWMNLEKAFFDGELLRSVQSRLEELSRYIEAHSHSDEYQEGLPSPSHLERALKDFQELKSELTSRKAAYTKTVPKSEKMLL